jgi:hypothetical protein
VIASVLPGLLLWCACSAAQAPQTQEGAEEDPTRAVFFSVREEYRNLTNGVWNNRVVLRKDAALLRGRRLVPRGFLTRADLPIATTHAGSETNTGLGDLYGQVLFVPHANRRFAFVAGTGMFFPTATDKTLGTGKWQIAPLFAPVWYLPATKGLFFVKVQNVISFAGVGDRQDIHYLLVTPTLLYRPLRRWWVLADFESRTNWENRNRADFRVGFQAGRVVRGKLGFAVKPEVPFGGTKLGDWGLKFSVIRYQ